MALNIFPRKPAQTATTEETEPTPAPAIETADEDNNESATTSRRRTTTRPRRTTARSRTTKADEEKTDGTADGDAEPDEAASKTSTDEKGEAAEDSPPSRRSRTTRSRARKADAEKADAEKAEADKGAGDQDSAETEPSSSRRRSSSRSTAKTEAPASASGVDLSNLVKAIEQQGKQLESLARAIQDGQGRGGAPSNPTYVPPARVGVFVDVANVELGADRARLRLDWGKVLRLLSRDRQLIRAIAYAPVHDDPQVSRETQRFVEPFLDRGYKIITKPLKRFSDGTIKANVDIELALDVVNMLDRLDVVCLVSGDGDFEPLVKSAQDRGVRVEVVAMSNSCSNHLRESADAFLDLQSRANELRA